MPGLKCEVWTAVILQSMEIKDKGLNPPPPSPSHWCCTASVNMVPSSYGLKTNIHREGRKAISVCSWLYHIPTNQKPQNHLSMLNYGEEKQII